MAATHTPFHEDGSLAPEVVPLQAAHLAGHGIATVFITVTNTVIAVHGFVLERRTPPHATIPLDPAANRVFVRFTDSGGTVRGSSSVAVSSEIPGSLDAIARLTRAGITVIVITNQSAVNRRMIPLAELQTMHRNLRQAVSRSGGRITDIFFCPHRPDENCGCRKPRPGMILADRPPRGLPWSYRAAYPIMRLLSFVPSLSIRAEELGQAMLQATLTGRREGTLENREIHAMAEQYQSQGKNIWPQMNAN